MTVHRFTVVARADDLTDDADAGAATADRLFEAGCDDAGMSWKGSTVFAEFDREADTLAAAVASAVAEVEAAGLEVVRVDPDELVYATEIAERTGRSRQSVDHLIHGRRGPGGFPAPVSHATRNPLWRWSEVEAWLAQHEGLDVDRERSATFAAVNGALDARAGLRQAPRPAELREIVRSIFNVLPPFKPTPTGAHAAARSAKSATSKKPAPASRLVHAKKAAPVKKAAKAVKVPAGAKAGRSR